MVMAAAAQTSGAGKAGGRQGRDRVPHQTPGSLRGRAVGPGSGALAQRRVPGPRGWRPGRARPVVGADGTSGSGQVQGLQGVWLLGGCRLTAC